MDQSSRREALIRTVQLAPRHIIDKAIENVPPGLPIEEWTYQRKFEASWEEYEDGDEPEHGWQINTGSYLSHRSPRVAAVSERSGAKLQAAEVFGRSSTAASPAVLLLVTSY